MEFVVFHCLKAEPTEYFGGLASKQDKGEVIR